MIRTTIVITEELKAWLLEEASEQQRSLAAEIRMKLDGLRKSQKRKKR